METMYLNTICVHNNIPVYSCAAISLETESKKKYPGRIESKVHQEADKKHKNSNNNNKKKLEEMK